jgi:hypothetical protein
MSERYTTSMDAPAPMQIIASRWFYVPPALLALPILYFGTITMRMAMHHHTPDAGLFGIGAIIALGGCGLLLNSLLHFVQPPRLSADGEGLSYASYRKAKRWAWSDIYALSMAGGRSTGVSFGWNEAGRNGVVPRRLFLDKSFLGLSGEPKPLYDRLIAAQTAAIGAPRGAPILALQALVRKTNPIWAFRSFQFFVFLFFLAHFVSLIDLGFADTELIAPTNRPFIWGAGCAAAAVACAIIMLVPLGITNLSPFGMPKSRMLPLRILLCAGGPLLSGLAFGHLAWRAEEMVAFSGSDAPFLARKIRVDRLNVSKGHARAWADGPAGDTLFLPLSDWDYGRIPDPFLRENEVCYPVYAQREGKAIRILKPGRAAQGEKRLFDCWTKTLPLIS